MAEVAFYEYSHMSVIFEKSFRMPKIVPNPNFCAICSYNIAIFG
jgi:hypothetical protein